tara:strand:+ start:38 stop:481 length:444 start_codon:yes stop_codon:yes gene_type:complete
MKRNKHLQKIPITGEGWQAFSKVSFDLSALDIGPHAKALMREMNVAIKSGLPIVVIILAATIADVVLNEGKIELERRDNAPGIGMDWLSVAERRQLDWLRGLRNRLVHYEGVIAGLGGTEIDQELLRKDANKALLAISPLLSGVEQF